MMIIDTIKTIVTGELCIIWQNARASDPQGQYLLRIIRAENGMVKANARSAAARSNINKLRGVRT